MRVRSAVSSYVVQGLSLCLLLQCLLLPGAASATLAAETPGRVIRGTVVDASDSPLRGATVSLRIDATTERTTLTDGTGRFVFDGVPGGVITITAIFDRFAPVTIDVPSPSASDPQPDVRIVLQPSAVSEQVTVSAPRLMETWTTTATKTDTPLRDVPQSVTVVSRDLIADQRMSSIGDVVRYVPGVGMAQGEGNRDTPILRGNSSTSDFFVDGVRDDVQYFRDLYNVERVEAFKGPNAMIFGRGGVGGVINRVVRQANWAPSREVSLQGGSWANRRLTGDLGQGVNERVAVRVTGVYENSDSYRDGFNLERYGINPTLAFTLGTNTTLRASYEHFHDERTADRGIPSFAGAPVATDASTFFGDPDQSRSRATVNILSSVLEHRFGSHVTLRNRVSFADYDKFYQNVFPGAVNAAGIMVNLQAYNNATQRQNLFNQTDLIVTQRTGAIDHTIVAGMELGRQDTDNFRNTGYFTSVGATATTFAVPIASPMVSVPVTFAQSATDANNAGVATLAAIYVQDQIALTKRIQAIVGLRYDHFNVDFTNNRTQAEFQSRDGLVSPRVGLVFKPVEPVSLYASYSLSYLPRAGEQLSSLSLTNQALDPEEFRNYEVGAKWDFAGGLSATAALYRLNRGNVVIPDPNDPTVSILVDGQRTQGVELGLGGYVTRAWSVMGAYAYQDGEITQTQSATVLAGATLAQLPKHSFSLWNKYDLTQAWGIGLGLIHRGDIFTSTDNTVTLPSFTRVDAAVYYSFSPRLRMQANIENLFDEDYYAWANGNNNITPGSPRALRVTLTTRF